jgi:hypothetical protein
MKIALIVRTTTESRKALCEFADFVKYEEVHNVSMANIETNLKTRDLAWFAWHSEKRRKVTALNFDDWCGTIEGIDIDTGEEPIVPLGSSQPTG